ncbi:hypothetical protein BD408DRAFT_379689 [Parasitella parasitica]|nr:hypothetical protein BD408DRAFT_379689 [Parasitella parasitica]
MPIMATHHQTNDSSLNNNAFYENAINGSPESPTSRKRKQEEPQYPPHSAAYHLELSSYYASNQHEQQQWHQQTPPHHQQQPQMQAATSDASSLVINFNSEANMQASSDISSWSHHHPLPQHSISTLMQPDFNMSDPQQPSAYDVSNSYVIHDGCNDISNKTGGGNSGVGENQRLSEIHQMLNLDQFTTATSTTSASVQTPTPSSYSFVDEPNDLHLTDLSTANLHQQSQLIQSWSNSVGGTANAQQSSYSNNGSGTPGFFTPGFLESLQETDNESYHTSDFPFHRQTHNSEWHVSSSSPQGIRHDPLMMSERSLVSQQDDMMSTSDTAQSSTPFHQNLTSTPSSPIPGLHRHNQAAPTLVATGILSSSISTTSSNPSPPPPNTTVAENAASISCFDDSNRFADHHRQHSLNAKLLQQHAVNETRMKPIIRNYLSNRYSEKERTVIILSSKVAQKSYGTEKRFLCPPPTAILVGKNWWTAPSQKLNISDAGSSNEVLKTPSGRELCPPKITVSISGETATQSGQIEWYTVSGVTVGQTGHVKPQQTASPSTSTTSTSTGSTAEQPQQQHPSRFRSSAESRSSSIDWYQNHTQELLAAGRCVSKHLYINDADEKRKRVEGLIRIYLANGTHMGALTSKGIKVISKPSKKRQSVKNMELCIHHGTTVSLFNRIRSQTVSTKYLGVSSSSSFSFPGQPFRGGVPGEGTCFVARTTCWDPFIIWLVDTNRSAGDVKESDTPEDYIGRSAFTRNIPYPPPPAIALRNKSNQLIPIHYNQHVVLQCLTTGLVSPVMIIRKVDKASTVFGGAQTTDNLSQMGGGEYGDEVLGDPVSQLHKVALQIVHDPQQQQQQQKQSVSTPSIMLPRTCSPINYLACLNDMVGMHKTTDTRRPIVPVMRNPKASSGSNTNLAHQWDDIDAVFNITSQEAGGKIVRKRRVSTDPSSLREANSKALFDANDIMNDPRRRVNSLNDDYLLHSNIPSMALPAKSSSQHHHQGISRKSSTSSNSSTNTGLGGRRSSAQNQAVNSLGAYWYEDVSDVAVWTIVGTDCATYTFLLTSEGALQDDSNIANVSCLSNVTNNTPTSAPFPTLLHMVTKPSLENKDQLQLSLHGENFSRDLQIWFGDIKATNVEYKSRELIVCRVPSKGELLPTKHTYDQIPILLVRGDGTVCKTNKTYLI